MEFKGWFFLRNISNFRTNYGLLSWYMSILSRYTWSLGVNFKSCLPFDGLGAKIAILKRKFWKRRWKKAMLEMKYCYYFFLQSRKICQDQIQRVPRFKKSVLRPMWLIKAKPPFWGPSPFWGPYTVPS